jgi:septum formation protein
MVEAIGVPFVVRPAAIDESTKPGESPGAYLERVVSAKLAAVCACDLGPSTAVLVADTIVVIQGGLMLGKPENERDALAMIERLAGRAHEVSTRFSLATLRARPLHSQTVMTRVTFRSIARDEALAYAASGEGRDKAGGYAAQGRAAAFVERIDGSYTNVVGLPLCEVLVAMRTLGWLSPA